MSNSKIILSALIAVCVFSFLGFISTTLMAVFLLPTVLAFCVYDVKQGATSQKTMQLTVVDYCFMAICAIEIISCFNSIYKPNSEGTVLKTLIMTILYFFVRTFVTHRIQMRYLCDVITCFAAFLSVTTLMFFVFHAQKYSELGSLEQYKGFYRPFGMLSNDWATVLLCLLPFSTIGTLNADGKKRLWFAAANCLNITCILVSFSRGAYISLALFIMASVAFSAMRGASRRTTLLLGAVTALAFALTLPVADSVLTTIRMNKTVSQQKSVEGRLTKYDEALKVFKEQPLLGVGGGNYTLAVERYCNAGQNDIFSPRCTNTYLQLLAERGIIGFCVYAALFVAVLLTAFRRARRGNADAGILLAAILALIFREVTFSSFFEVDSIPLLFTLMCLIATHDYKDGEYEIFKR
ncbi:MAG: O-antigen ligase family protein [Salinivirgaceae bacterium]|nr:O-antigen ligase family protein [Salinivirgaceae bacterium]